PVAGQSLTLAQRYHFIAGWLPWIGDSLHLIFTLLLLLGAGLMTFFPRYFMMPSAAFAMPVLLITPFNLIRSIWLYRRRVPCSWRQSVAACVAGLGLTYTIGVSCIYSMVTTRRPFGRTPKCQNQSALFRSLAMARDESILLGLLWAGLFGVWATRPHIDNAHSVVWLVCMALQSLPYLAAVSCALVSSLPAFDAAAANFGQYRRVVMARRGKTMPQFPRPFPATRPIPSPVPMPMPMPVPASMTAAATS
ncbi:MAG: hypothetical protein IT440_01725, partial [Phycisphaeraceae bacterium]|nr:hypothetical protein [Phycisphaeraceae bacterium]